MLSYSILFKAEEHQGRPLEEIAKQVIPFLPNIYGAREILSKREILGSFCNHKELGDLTMQESVSVVNYLIKERVITFSYHHNGSWYRLAKDNS